MALAKPGGVLLRIRSASMLATNALTAKPVSFAASCSMFQNSGSKLIDV
jgi:hypothetical protein